MNNHNLAFLGLGIGAVTIGGIVYANLNGELKDTKAQLESVEKERNSLLNQVEEKDNDIDNLDEIIKGNSKDLETQLEEVRRWKQQTEIVGTCLQGVAEAMSYVSEDDAGSFLITLGRVEDECNQAEEILEEMEKEQSSTFSEGASSISTTEPPAQFF